MFIGGSTGFGGGSTWGVEGFISSFGSSGASLVSSGLISGSGCLVSSAFASSGFLSGVGTLSSDDPVDLFPHSSQSSSRGLSSTLGGSIASKCGWAGQALH